MTVHRVHTIAERQAAWRKYYMCLAKRRYETKTEALAKNVKVYRCPHCGKFHRATKKKQ